MPPISKTAGKPTDDRSASQPVGARLRSPRCRQKQLPGVNCYTVVRLRGFSKGARANGGGALQLAVKEKGVGSEWRSKMKGTTE